MLTVRGKRGATSCWLGLRAKFQKDLLHARRHGLRILGMLVSMSQEMQDAVYEKIKDHLVFGVAKLGSVIRCPVRANHYIAQEILPGSSVPLKLRKG